MFCWQSLLKLGYLTTLGTAVFVLSKPEPVQAQRAIAYQFLPGALTNALSMSVLAGQSSPLTSYTQAVTMLAQAQSPLDPFGVGMSGGLGLFGGAGGAGAATGAGMGGGMMGMGGGMMGMGGGLRGMGGGFGGRGGFGGGMMGMGGMGMGGGRGGVGGMGGFAGKGFGGFNGKNAL